jgi:hypothetical protein
MYAYSQCIERSTVDFEEEQYMCVRCYNELCKTVLNTCTDETTNSTELSPSEEATSCAATQKFPTFLET